MVLQSIFPVLSQKSEHILVSDLKKDWLVIVNPASGGGKGRKVWKDTEQALVTGGISFETVLSRNSAHLSELASVASRENRTGIMIVGGDGTASYVIRGLSSVESHSPILAMIPAGTGNDWVKTLKISNTASAVEAIVSGRTERLDIGQCSIRSGNTLIYQAKYMNSAGLGLDAHVLMKTLAKRKHKPLKNSGYMGTLIATLMNPPSWNAEMTVDGNPVFSGDYLSLTLGVCKYAGGGMQPSPCSVPDDGLIDAVIIRPASRIRLYWNLPRLFNGTMLGYKSVSSWKGKCISIKSSGKIKIELDGEAAPKVFEGDITVTFTSLPKAINVIVGRDYSKGD